jgi:hypothetical protein
MPSPMAAIATMNTIIIASARRLKLPVPLRDGHPVRR